MKGTITDVKLAADGRIAASVELDGDVEGEGEGEHQRRRVVHYWPELVEQWGADAVRAHVLQLAADERDAELAKTVMMAPHLDVVGQGDAAAVCRLGHIACTDEHPAPPPSA